MAYTSVEDFFEKAAAFKRLSREAERSLGAAVGNGDLAAKEQLVQSYIPMVAGHIQRFKPPLQSLRLVYACLQALEKAVESFDFTQDSEPFSHRLSWWLRQTTTEHIASRNG